MESDTNILVKKTGESEFTIQGLCDAYRKKERNRSANRFEMIYLTEGRARLRSGSESHSAEAPALLIGKVNIWLEWILSTDMDGFFFSVEGECMESMEDCEWKDLLSSPHTGVSVVTKGFPGAMYRV